MFQLPQIIFSPMPPLIFNFVQIALLKFFLLQRDQLIILKRMHLFIQAQNWKKAIWTLLTHQYCVMEKTYFKTIDFTMKLLARWDIWHLEVVVLFNKIITMRLAHVKMMIRAFISSMNNLKKDFSPVRNH